MSVIFASEVLRFIKSEYEVLKNIYAIQDLLSGNPIREFPKVRLMDVEDLNRELHWVNLGSELKDDPARFAPSFASWKETEDSIVNSLKYIIEVNQDSVYDITDRLRFGFDDLDTALALKLSI